MQKEKIVIFASGNPDLYPLEYYDADTQTYKGLIPQMLSQFSEQSQYDIQYLQPDSKDQREHLAENKQVDLISGCVPGEDFLHTRSSGITVLETEEDGETVVYQLLFTEMAPKSFRTELREFFSEVSQEARTGLLLQVREEAQEAQTKPLWNGIIALSILIVLLLGAIAAIIYRYQKQLKRTEQNKETDEITGIGNAVFLERNYPLMATDQTRVLYTAICFYIDTDKMYRLCGYEETKEFLRHTAAILNEYIEQRDLLAMVPGVGFVMIKMANLETIQKWLPTSLARIREFSQRYKKSYTCEVNCGVYSLQNNSRELDEILFKILQSAKMAYQNGKDYIICSPDVIEEIEQERRLQGEIAAAFEKEEFQLYLQFYVNPKTHQIVGGESLARWQHPEKGFLTPEYFIPLMEQEHLIDRMDYYMLEKACIFLDEIKKRGIHDFFISCNFSRKSFRSPEFVIRCKEIIEQYSFERNLLIFELKGDAQTQSSSHVLQNIQQMKKELGVQIVLDDFGVSFTSFYDLQKYPVDGIKLDKDLVDPIHTAKGHTIMRTMIQMGNELGLITLVEGIENDIQLNLLQDLNCDAIQGFYFHHPIPTWEAEKELLENRIV